MVCKQGYRGPLCAVCGDGYFQSMKDCVPCEEPKVGVMVALVVIVLALLSGCLYFARKYRRHLERVSAFAHLKVVISFVTVALTLNTQFHVTWPPKFAAFLDALSVVSMDFGTIFSVGCVVDISFYQRLLSSTILLLVLVVVMLLAPRMRERAAIHFTNQYRHSARSTNGGIFATVYLLLFAYPILSVRIVEAFSCHEVEGRSFLRADYRIECFTPHWHLMAAYAGVWATFYVAGFPLLILYKLWSYRTDPLTEDTSNERINLRFLLHDYRPLVPSLLWEYVEIVRKLLLSVIGAFWSTQSTMAIATALFISIFFLVLHAHVWPYRSFVLNCVQTLALSILTLLYFIGLLLNTDSVEQQDQQDLGVLMVAMFAAVFVSVLMTVLLELRAVMEWMKEIKEIKYATAAVEQEPEYDPSLKDYIIDPKLLQLGAILGKGAEGVVRKAIYEGTEVAVKIENVLPEGAVQMSLDGGSTVREMLENAQTEAQMLCPLRHPQVVAFYGLAILHASFDIKVMTVIELCEGGALDGYIYDTATDISWGQKLVLLHQIAQGFTYLHSKGVMHRDLKPANVLLDGTRSSCKIADFGMAKKKTGDENPLAEQTANIGTPVYMAPELMVDSGQADYDGSLVDVYAFGILMWVVLTRTKVYEKVCRERKLNVWSLRDLILGGGRPDTGIEDALDHEPYSACAVRLMKRCWSADPSARPSGFDEIQKLLATQRSTLSTALEQHVELRTPEKDVPTKGWHRSAPTDEALAIDEGLTNSVTEDGAFEHTNPMAVQTNPMASNVGQLSKGDQQQEEASL
jgi:serine/threonine protein kinase